MDLIADALLLAGAVTAAVYCWVLSKRVKGLNDLDTGLGSAIASLSNEVNDMQIALKAAQSVTGASVTEMADLADRAERAAERLKLMLATVQEEKEEAPRKSARVRKFPKPAAPSPEPESAHAQEMDDIPLRATRADPPVTAPSNAPTESKTPEQSPAEKLQQDIVSRISDRDTQDERDAQSSREELVQALQSILAASK